MKPPMTERRKSTYEDEFEALQAMILNSDREFKQVAVHLFPHLSAQSAYARLKNCLNPERDERLAFGDILRAMQFCDRFDPLYHACNVSGHRFPERKASENLQSEIVETIASATAVLASALEKLEQMDTTTKVRSVS